MTEYSLIEDSGTPKKYAIKRSRVVTFLGFEVYRDEVYLNFYHPQLGSQEWIHASNPFHEKSCWTLDQSLAESRLSALE